MLQAVVEISTMNSNRHVLDKIGAEAHKVRTCLIAMMPLLPCSSRPLDRKQHLRVNNAIMVKRVFLVRIKKEYWSSSAHMAKIIGLYYYFLYKTIEKKVPVNFMVNEKGNCKLQCFGPL